MWTVPLRFSTSHSEPGHMERKTPEVTPPGGPILPPDDFSLQEVSTSETSQSHESFDECKPSTSFSYDIRPEVLPLEPEVIPVEPEVKPIFSGAEPIPGPSSAYHEEHQLVNDMCDEALQRLLEHYDPSSHCFSQVDSEFRGERSCTKFGKPVGFNFIHISFKFNV